MLSKEILDAWSIVIILAFIIFVIGKFLGWWQEHMKSKQDLVPYLWIIVILIFLIIFGKYMGWW